MEKLQHLRDHIAAQLLVLRFSNVRLFQLYGTDYNTETNLYIHFEVMIDEISVVNILYKASCKYDKLNISLYINVHD